MIGRRGQCVEAMISPLAADRMRWRGGVTVKVERLVHLDGVMFVRADTL